MKERTCGSRRAGDADARIGRQIRHARIARALSQEKLAELVGVSCQQLQKYETGANRIPATRIVEFSDALGVNVSVILRGIDAVPSLGPSGPSSSEIMLLLADFCRITKPENRKKLGVMAALLATDG